MPPANDTKPSGPDNITGSFLTRRLYLPIILQQSLVKVFKKEKPIRVLDDPVVVPADIYETFVNTLGHVCDSAKGGDTVTAFAILSHLDVIQYHFTSNRRDAQDYDRTSDFITGILNILGKATDEEVARRVPNGTPSAVFECLLRKILRFNQSRIKGYMHSLNMNVRFCFISARGDSSEDALVVVEHLEHLGALLRQMFAFCDGSATGIDFDDVSRPVIQAINMIYTPQFKEYLHIRTRNTTDPDAPWVIVGHCIGRLLSYYYDVDILCNARRQWPRLFEDFEVHWIRSADMHRFPKLEIPRSKLNAAMIIRKMYNEPLKSELTEYAAGVERSGISLNAEISRIAYTTKASLHAEVNLHGHILRLLRRQDASVFFNGTRYIGCSKPACRLCKLWFDNHPSGGVRVRGGQKNLYPEWHPALFREPAEGEVGDATLALIRMIPLICNQAAADLRDGYSTRSLNHSNDVPANLPLTCTCTGTDVVSTGEMDGLVSMVAELAV